jgi:hypothetical protein
MLVGRTSGTCTFTSRFDSPDIAEDGLWCEKEDRAGCSGEDEVVTAGPSPPRAQRWQTRSGTRSTAVKFTRRAEPQYSTTTHSLRERGRLFLLPRDYHGEGTETERNNPVSPGVFRTLHGRPSHFLLKFRDIAYCCPADIGSRSCVLGFPDFNLAFRGR